MYRLIVLYWIPGDLQEQDINTHLSLYHTFHYVHEAQ